MARPSLDDIYGKTTKADRPSLDDIYAGNTEAAPITPEPTELEKEISTMGPLKRGLIGMGQGFVDVGRGAQQLFYDVTGQKDKSRATREQGTEERRMIAPLGTAGKVGQFVGKTAPFVVLPGGVGGNALRRAFTAGLAGAGQGAAEFVPEGGSRIANIGIGTAGGAAGSAAMSGVGKLINTPKTTVPTNKYDIPTTLAESNKGMSSRTDVLMERAPGFFGTKGFREKQHDAALAAAKQFVGNYIADPVAGVAGNRAFVSGLYKEMKDAVAGAPQFIAPTQTRSTAKDLLEQFPEVFDKLQNSKLKNQINSIIEGTSKTKKSTILGPGGKPIETEAFRSFDDMWQLRQALGENLGFAKRELNQSNYRKYKDLWLAVSKDMEDWAGSVGRKDVMDKFKSANDAYKTYVVKHRVVQQAYDKVVNEIGDKTFFSPQKFANALKGIIQKDKDMGTFTKSEVAEMSGLANIMQVVKRSGQYLENPPTGNRWGALTAGGAAEATMYKAGGVAGMLKGTAIAGLTAGATKFLTTTKPGKKLAMAASKMDPTSPAMKRVVEAAIKGARSMGATAGEEMAAPILEAPDLNTELGVEDWLNQEFSGGAQ